MVSLSSDRALLLVDPNSSFKVWMVGVTSAFVSPPFLRGVGESPAWGGKVATALRFRSGECHFLLAFGDLVLSGKRNEGE